MKKFAKWLAAIFLIIPSEAFAPWRVGNGGDALRLAFAKAKQHAAAVTSKINAAALPDGKTNPAVKEWILAHKDRLAAAILGAEHHWVLDAKPTCAWVSHGGGFTGDDPTAVYLSLPTCRMMIDDYREAAELLVHESVHHLGVGDEAFADAVALAIYDAVDAGLTVWQPIAQAPTAVAEAASVWTGEDVLLFGGVGRRNALSNQLLAYNPDTDHWRLLASGGLTPRRAANAVWSGEKLLVWGGYDGSDAWLNDGGIFDMQTGRWTLVSPPRGPSKLYGTHVDRGKLQTLVWTGSKALVWGGSSFVGSGSVVPGYKIDPSNGSIVPFAGVSSAHRLQGHVAQWSGKHMIVWGGIDSYHSYSTGGMLYDPASGNWSPMTSEDSPSARYGHTGVWTGKELIVFGRASGAFLGDGGAYNPETDTWKSFKSETVLSRARHTAVWTGREMLVYGGYYRRGIRFSSVGAFNPTTLRFRAIEGTGALAGRTDHAAVWTGSGMVVVGGSSRTGTLGDGAMFLP